MGELFQTDLHGRVFVWVHVLNLWQDSYTVGTPHYNVRGVRVPFAPTEFCEVCRDPAPCGRRCAS